MTDDNPITFDDLLQAVEDGSFGSWVFIGPGRPNPKDIIEAIVLEIAEVRDTASPGDSSSERE